MGFVFLSGQPVAISVGGFFCLIARFGLFGLGWGFFVSFFCFGFFLFYFNLKKECNSCLM